MLFLTNVNISCQVFVNLIRTSRYTATLFMGCKISSWLDLQHFEKKCVLIEHFLIFLNIPLQLQLMLQL